MACRVQIFYLCFTSLNAFFVKKRLCFTRLSKESKAQKVYEPLPQCLKTKLLSSASKFFPLTVRIAEAITQQIFLLRIERKKRVYAVPHFSLSATCLSGSFPLMPDLTM